MSRKLKVYGWYEMVAGGRQARRIVAATSQREVARIAGVKWPSGLFNLSETWSKAEVPVAMEEPGIMFEKDSRAPAKAPYIRVEAPEYEP